MHRVLAICFFFSMLILSLSCEASHCLLARDDVKCYIHHITHKYDFDYERLARLFSTVIMNEEVVTHLKKPAEAKPWFEYYHLVVTQDKVNKGVAYWHTHEKTLALAEQKYGVPASIIVAIIGIETQYGANKGTYPVFNTLATLAFNNGRRTNFFRSELTEYLILSRENGFRPLLLKGSYAGALGLPQFMPSSYRHYAVDFYSKGFVDLFNNDADAIGSIGNYLKKHGWKQDESVVIPARVAGDCSPLYRNSFKPHLTEAKLAAYHVYPLRPLHNSKVALIRLQEADDFSHWLCLQNFYTISTYNKSELYVMAVNALAQKIREQKYGAHEKRMAVIPVPYNWQERQERQESCEEVGFPL